MSSVEVYLKGKGRRVWWIRFADARGLRRAISSESRQRRHALWLGRTLERLVDHRRECRPLPDDLVQWITAGASAHQRDLLARWGVLETRATAAATPLLSLLNEWCGHLQGCHLSAKHVNYSYRRVRSLLDGLGAISDASPNLVYARLSALRTRGLGDITYNHYVTALRAFGSYLVAHRQAWHNPWDDIRPLPTPNRRHRRRALGEDEAARLIAAAERGPVRCGLTGTERGTLYRLALGSGLRAGEIAHLTPADLQLTHPPYTVTVSAAYSKRRRQDVQVIPVDLADHLRDAIKLLAPGARAIRLPRLVDLSRMLAADLADAGIARIDEAGRVVDFHALRHTYITHLARAGVHPRLAQQLARHSTIELTMQVYTHLGLLDEAAAVEKLPRLSGERSGGGDVTQTRPNSA